MVRLTLLLLGLLLAAGCSTTRKVVVRHGYPGVADAPAGFEARPATRAEIEHPARLP